MLADRQFQIALLISIILHSIMFWQMPHFKLIPSKKALHKIEVNYYKIEHKLSKLKLSPKVSIKRRMLAERNKPRAIRKGIPSPKIENFKTTHSKLIEKPLEKPVVVKGVSIKKEPVEDKERIVAKAEYLNYYQRLRNEIQRWAYRNYPPELIEGEIYLCFTISSSGGLRQLKIIDEKSSSQSSLRKAALDSVRDASPFPPFPKELNLPQLTFKVIISFELGR